VNRSRLLDELRGLAVALMVLDHLLIFVAPGHWLRATVTRAAMPLFFVVAGHLARRVRWRRLLGVAAVGAALPAVVPWLDRPNVLLLYAVGVPVVVWARSRGLLPLVIAAALTLAANGWADPTGHAYWAPAVVALMATGALIRFREVELGRGVVPPGAAHLARLGRYPLSVYVGHALGFTALAALR
jgi:surface polysaccharide O-acyltransferase-like enzyme